MSTVCENILGTLKICTCQPGSSGGLGILSFADFFALMPPDNAATVGIGEDVSFPQNGPTSGTNITRIGPTTFNLSAIGTYQVLFQVSVTEPGQLILTLNNADIDYTVVGRATGNFSDSRNGSCKYDSSQFNTYCEKSCRQCGSTNHHSYCWRSKVCFSAPHYYANRTSIVYLISMLHLLKFIFAGSFVIYILYTTAKMNYSLKGTAALSN